MNKARLLFIIIITLFSFNTLFAQNRIFLLNVYYLKEPLERLIFECSDKPKYEITKEDKKLVLTLHNTIPSKTNWIQSIPKELFKEFNIFYEKNNLVIELTSYKNFNFQSSIYENRLIVDFIWEGDKKPLMITIKGNDTKKSMQDTLELPKYEYPLSPSLKNVSLPFTKKYKGTPISVDFQEADIHAVLRLLAEVGNINIVTSEKVKGNITLRVKQVPWDQILDIVLSSFGLGMVQIGNVIRIAPIDEIRAESEALKNYLTSLKDIQEKGPLLTKTFQLKYVKGDAILSSLKEIITGEGKITLEPSSNLLIVKDTEKNLKEIERIIKEIDKPKKQVLIEARIVEIQDNYIHKLGIRWGGVISKATEHTSLTLGPIIDLGTVGTTNLGFHFGHFGKSIINLDFQLSALESRGVGRIFARPKILTLDNHDAEIKQGYRIPYQTLDQYGRPQTNFIDAVLRLKVTPHITPDNRLSLDIEIEKSAPDWGRLVQGVPAVLTKFTKTRVLINNGDTLVIGGIKTKEISEGLGKVPGVSRVPSIGELFKKREKTYEKMELMVFLTPRIVSVEIPGVDY